MRGCAQVACRNLAILFGNTRGVALVEFAFALPIFVILLFGGLEVANLARTHSRINQIAITVADNAGRVRTGIDETNIEEVFAGADLIGGSLNFAENGRVVLSSLQDNEQEGANAGQMIHWQRCHGSLPVAPRYGVEGKGRLDDTLANGLGEEGNRIRAVPGSAVMFVEVTYNYEPLIAGIISEDPIVVRYESAFNVRERTNQNLTNTSGIAANTCN